MFVKDCWVNGIRRLIISKKGEEEEFFEIRTEWSDRNILYLHRSYSDLGRLFKRLLDSFPEDRGELSQCALLEGLMKIKEAHDIEARLNEVERLLKNTINMPWKPGCGKQTAPLAATPGPNQAVEDSISHGALRVVGESPLAREAATKRPGGEIMRSNGFCLANTETIVFDHSLPNGKEHHHSMDSDEQIFENGTDFIPEFIPDTENNEDDPEAYVTNLSYYHLVPFETDILE
ncbi:PXDC1 protein, partial [Polypterus senegalus]